MGHESQRSKYMLKVYNSRASLVGPWLRIHLPMQGTWVPSLVQGRARMQQVSAAVCYNS